VTDPSLSRDKPAKKSEGGFGETLRVIVEALAIALVVRTFLFQPFNIPSGSMIPTLLIGDYLFVSKYSYGYSKHSFPFSILPVDGRFLFVSEPKRGDVVVFKLPKDNSTDYIKRVVGLPGDRIQVIQGVLHINGSAVKLENNGSFLTGDRWSRPVSTPLIKETLPGGVSHNIIELEGAGAYLDNTNEYVVPTGHFFFMGDNRDNSQDSRVLSEVGFVPFENLVGRAEIIFFSMEEDARFYEFWRWPWSIRWDRMFRGIR
jgi:signal peptidase I